MKGRDFHWYKQSLSDKTDDELLRIASEDRGEYEQQAVSAALELLCEHLAVPVSESEDEMLAEVRKQLEIKRTEESKRLLDRIAEQIGRCNICGNAEAEARIPVYVGEHAKRDWKDTLASLSVSTGISLVTLPLLGIGKIQVPGRRVQIVDKFEFLLCQSCDESHNRLLRRVNLNSIVENSALAKHLLSQGYSLYLREDLE